ncbi:ABC transporter ATP-binding protein [Haloquadratum walsbyi]|uniref:ABC transporter ATP-binding protein n=1 Tax=Haloquadratum walsbyi TaxID=293091 RepID=UPI000AFE583E|nr:ABC transporter ATP-binding protein [Haloquadratum walsbyi]
MATFEATGLLKSFGSTRAVDKIDFTVESGEFFALIGPSGCGKTTTLRLLAGLTAPDAGTVRLGDSVITNQPARTRDTNMVFQDLVLFPHLTVAENVGYALARKGIGDPERSRRVGTGLELVNLDGFGDREPASLSGGQQQRVALARALVNDPSVLLLDEPLASLDRSLKQGLQSEFRRIQRESETTFLYVTHDQTSAISMADRIAVMRDGKIVDVGSPRRLYTRPATRFVATFLGDATILRGTVTQCNIAESTVAVDTPIGMLTPAMNGINPDVGDTVTIALRPTAFTLANDGIGGTVITSAYKGFYEEATVEIQDTVRVIIRTDAHAEQHDAQGDTSGHVESNIGSDKSISSTEPTTTVNKSETVVGESPADITEHGQAPFNLNSGLQAGDSITLQVDGGVLVADAGYDRKSNNSDRDHDAANDTIGAENTIAEEHEPDLIS